jgi:anti-sigma-K factor RskA
MQPDVHAMTGAYALDALEEFERRQFERHLAECPECTREVDELRATAVRLAVAAAEQPPDRLRGQVMAEIAETGQLAPPLPVAQVPARRRSRVGDWTIRLTAVAATAAAAVLAVVVVRADQARDAAQAQLAQLQGQYAQVTQLAAAPDAVGASGTGVAGGHAFVVVSQSQDEGVLLVSDLPAVPAGRTYQAWLIGAGNPRSIGLVQPDTRTVEFGDLGSSSKVGLTIEPAGGSPQPTTKPVVVVNMPT